MHVAGALVWSRLTMAVRPSARPESIVAPRPTLLGPSEGRWPAFVAARRRARARMWVDRLVEAIVWSVGLVLIGLLVAAGLLALR